MMRTLGICFQDRLASHVKCQKRTETTQKQQHRLVTECRVTASSATMGSGFSVENLTPHDIQLSNDLMAPHTVLAGAYVIRAPL